MLGGRRQDHHVSTAESVPTEGRSQPEPAAALDTCTDDSVDRPRGARLLSAGQGSPEIPGRGLSSTDLCKNKTRKEAPWDLPT